MTQRIPTTKAGTNKGRENATINRIRGRIHQDNVSILHKVGSSYQRAQENGHSTDASHRHHQTIRPGRRPGPYRQTASGPAYISYFQPANSVK
jgi:hypothetical protein